MYQLLYNSMFLCRYDLSFLKIHILVLHSIFFYNDYVANYTEITLTV